MLAPDSSVMLLPAWMAIWPPLTPSLPSFRITPDTETSWLAWMSTLPVWFSLSSSAADATGVTAAAGSSSATTWIRPSTSTILVPAASPLTLTTSLKSGASPTNFAPR